MTIVERWRQWLANFRWFTDPKRTREIVRDLDELAELEQEQLRKFRGDRPAELGVAPRIARGRIKDLVSRDLSPPSQGLCDTTQTERFDIGRCTCRTYADNLGPCMVFVAGDAAARCVYCDHVRDCHERLQRLRPARSSHDVLTRALGMPTSDRERVDREDFVGSIIKADKIKAEPDPLADLARLIGQGNPFRPRVDLDALARKVDDLYDGEPITEAAAISRVYALMQAELQGFPPLGLGARSLRERDLLTACSLFRRLWPEIIGGIDAAPPKAE